MGVPMTYDPLKDFAPVSLLTRNTVILAVHPSLPGQLAAGVHRAGARKTRADVLCVVRRRRAEPSRRRDFQPDDRPRHRPCAVCRHRRGHSRRHLQSGRRHVGFFGRADPAYPRRHARRCSPSAAGSACRSCRRYRRSPNPACPATRPIPGSACSRRRDTAADRRAAAGGHPCCHANSCGQRFAVARRLRNRRQQARGVRQVMERDYAKYAKLRDLLKGAHEANEQHPTAQSRARWLRLPPISIPRGCPTTSGASSAGSCSIICGSVRSAQDCLGAAGRATMSTSWGRPARRTCCTHRKRSTRSMRRS